MYEFDVQFGGSPEENKKLIDWVREHKGQFFIRRGPRNPLPQIHLKSEEEKIYHIVTFENKSDALLFKLTF